MQTAAETPGEVSGVVRAAHALPRSRRWFAPRPLRSPSLWLPLVIYALSRVVGYVLFSVAQRQQMPMQRDNQYIAVFYPFGRAPGYWSTVSNWDGQWYHRIAAVGYPDYLPREPDGSAMMNPYAFFPVYPMTGRAIMKVTGWDWIYVGPVLATLAGAVAMVLLHHLVETQVGTFAAITTVTATCCFMSAPVLQASYTESFALVLILSALLLLRRRAYVAMAATVCLLALTRNVVAAMVPVIVAHAVHAYRHGTEGKRPRLFRVGMGLLCLVAFGSTWLWPTIVDSATGEPDSYSQTLIPWGIDAISFKAFKWFGFGYDTLTLPGVVLAFAALVAYAVLLLSRHVRSWGPELWGWAGAYPAYMLFVVSPNVSAPRYALLAFPFGLAIAWLVTRPRVWRWRWYLLGAVALLGIVLQWVWVTEFFVVQDWRYDAEMNCP